MRIPLDKSSPEPLYRQIQGFLRKQILSRTLPPDSQLPSSRSLADELGVSRITVTNAYAELEAEGLILTRAGSGTYVETRQLAAPAAKAGRLPNEDWPLWQQELLSRTWLPTFRTIESLHAAVTHPQPISFTSGLGSPEIFPVDEFRKTLNTALRHDAGQAFGYGDRAGNPALRTTIAHILTSQGIPTTQDEVLITSGSQQAIALVARLLLQPGDVIVVESPTYVGAIDLFRSLDVRLLGVPMDENGMLVEHLEQLLQTSRPRLIYTIPTFHNPTGSCLSASRRRHLTALAARHNIPILEDDCFGDLRYDGRALPALKALDPAGNVIYTNTFSKVLMPGLRIGYLVASGPVYDRLTACKHATDLSTCNPIQHALDAYITVGRYHAYVRRACRLYRQRRDALVAALKVHAPPPVHWDVPQGGLFLWLQLPPDCSASELFSFAAEEGVTYAPGSIFFPGERAQPGLRLNFVMNSAQVNVQGAERLGRAITRYLKSHEAKPAKQSRHVAV